MILKIDKERMRSIVSVQSQIIRSTREFLEKKGFLEILPPCLDSITDPGIRGARIVEVELYGKKYKLMSAMTVHKPILAKYLGKIFSFCPCYRIEKEHLRDTKRHLAQFWQIEVEIPGVGYEEAMKTAEELLRFVCKKVKEKCKKELEILQRKLEIPRTPFKRIKHEDAVMLARKLGVEASFEEELPWEAERAISMKAKQPFFIIDFPAGSRGFYDKTEGGKCLSFDLIYDSGFGEGCSGSEREYECDKILTKIRGSFIEECDWYLEEIKKGLVRTSGFGIGLERLTRYVCGLQDIKEATLFPIVPGGG